MIAQSEEIRGKGARKILYGHIHTLVTGEKLYIARRKRAQIYRSGKSSISGAMQNDIAAWAIDESLLYSLRAKGVAYIGVREEDTDDLYLTQLSVFLDRTKSKLLDYTGVGRGGSRQRYLPLQFFAQKRGVVQLDADAL